MLFGSRIRGFVLVAICALAMLVTACNTPSTQAPQTTIVENQAPTATSEQMKDATEAIATITPDLMGQFQLAMDHFQKGSDYYLKGDYEEAIDELNAALKLKPDLVDALILRASSYLFGKEYDLAIADCEEAISLSPNHSNAHLCRGGVYYMKGDYDRALADCTRAIEVNSNDPLAYFCRGDVYKKKGDKQAAVAEYKQAMQVSKDSDVRQKAEEQLKALDEGE